MGFLDPESRQQFRLAGRYGAIGIELGLSLFVGYGIGWWLDGQLGTKPWLSNVGLAFGFAAGVRSVYRLIRRAKADLEAEDDNGNISPE